MQTYAHLEAIGFDLFDTLITVKKGGIREAQAKLTASLREQGFDIEQEVFIPAYVKAAQQHMTIAQLQGRETHNRFWISEALNSCGYDVSADDQRLSRAIKDYFSSFSRFTELIPGTLEMLAILKRRYRLGLLSNFTHGPAAREILTVHNLRPFFEVIVISGELGFRKPHPETFSSLIKGFDLPPERLVFIGDNPIDDIQGARESHMQTIRMSYALSRDNNSMNRIIHRPDFPEDLSVPTIHCWEDLFSLLGLRGPL